MENFTSLTALMKIIRPLFVYVYCIVLCCTIFHALFSCCIKSTSIPKIATFAICLEDIWSCSKEERFLWFGKLGIIHYPAIFLFLISNYLIVSKLNCLLIFLLLLPIFSLNKWYCPITFSIVLNFHYYYIIKVIYYYS